MDKRTREDWLKEATLIIEKDILQGAETQLPEDYKVSVGFPSSASAIGQAWDKEACEDKKTYHMFISPQLGNHDKVNLLQVLLHEMIHICVGIDQGHGGEFKRVARKVGLEGRLTSTYVSPGTELHDKLLTVYSKVGWDYPHVVLVKKEKEKKERQSNFVKLVSVSDPSYEVKMKKDLYALGAPFDLHGEQMVPLEEGE